MGIRQAKAVEVLAHLAASSPRALPDDNGRDEMLKRTYFYSATRRNKSGDFAWWKGTFSTRSWLPASASDLLEFAEREAQCGIDMISEGQIWHDRKPRLVALNRL